MGHPNAPFTPEGRRRLVERIDAGVPISHVAAEANVSRQSLTTWYKRWIKEGEAGLEDRSSRPHHSPNLLPDLLGDRIEELRREHKWGPDRISGYIAINDGHDISPATVYRELKRRGLAQLRNIDPPTGLTSRYEVVRYEKQHPGDMLHIDVKKVGKIPQGGGWAVHGRDSEQARQSQRKANKRPGYTFLHACVDDFSRLAYVEPHENEQAVTAVGFFNRCLGFYASHGVTVKEVLTDNGSAYRSGLWKAALRDVDVKHRRTRRQTPRTNGKVERFNLTMKNEWLSVRAYMSEEARREALIPFLNDYNHRRSHSSLGNRPPISRILVPGPELVLGVPLDYEVIDPHEPTLPFDE